MKVVIDDKIPYIGQIESLEGWQVVFASGGDIDKGLVEDADALIVRTRTKCDRHLLEGSKVRFIATATIGFDHIDTKYCEDNNIFWTNVAGCNSSSVAQYIENSLICWSNHINKPLAGMTIGVVGVGNVGKKVVKVASDMGLRILQNDPIREEKEGFFEFCSLGKVMSESDIITFHVPLTMSGKYATYHLANDNFFNGLERKPLIINSSRGEVVDTTSIKKAISQDKISGAIIDVWENEPNIDEELLHKCFISTPHIAGYSADGKANATQGVIDAFCKFFDLDLNIRVSPPEPKEKTIVARTMEEALVKIYDPLIDSTKLKEDISKFEWFRGNYPLRREKSAYKIIVRRDAPV